MTNAAGPAIVCLMIGSHRLEGYAIVSADGMIADHNGIMPEAIRNEADHRQNPARTAGVSAGWPAHDA